MASSNKMLRLDTAEEDPALTITHKVQDTDALVQRYKVLFNQERFSDIVLRVEDQQYFAHRFVLISASQVFQIMLSHHQWKESTQPEISLTEEEECVLQFENFLGYLYSGEVELKTMTVLPLLLLADKYEVDSLRSSCLKFMMEHIVQAPNTNRALTWYQYAQVTGQEELRDKCLSFILSNFDTVMQASDWLYMLPQELTNFLEHSDMVLHSEGALWNHVEIWLVYDSNKDQLEDHLRLVLPYIRFTMMSPKELLKIEQSSLYQDHKVMFCDKVSQAYRTHSLSLIRDDDTVPSLSSAGDTDGSVTNRLGQEPYRNYRSEPYVVAHRFNLSDFVKVQKVDTRISLEVQAMHKFIVPDRMRPEDLTHFSAYFYPKGYFTTITLYGSYMSRQNSDLTLKVIRRRPDLVPMKVEVTLLLKGKKHNLNYAAFSQSWTFVFTKENNTLSVDKFLSADCLADQGSPYLVDGSLQGTLFLKIQDVGAHLVKVK